MATTTRRQETEEFVADLSGFDRDRMYARTQLTPFEQCAVFGYENCPVSHPALTRESSKRGGILCEQFANCRRKRWTVSDTSTRLSTNWMRRTHEGSR